MSREIIYDFDPRNWPQDALAAIGLSVATQLSLGLPSATSKI